MRHRQTTDGYVTFVDRAGHAVAVGTDEIVVATTTDVTDPVTYTEAAGVQSSEISHSMGYDEIPSLVSGHAVAYARSGPQAKARLRERLTGASQSLLDALESSQVVGASLTDRTDSDNGFALRYASITDNLDQQVVDDLVADATTGRESLSAADSPREERTVVIDGVVNRTDLFTAHAQLAGRPAISTQEVTFK